MEPKWKLPPFPKARNIDDENTKIVTNIFIFTTIISIIAISINDGWIGPWSYWNACSQHLIQNIPWTFSETSLIDWILYTAGNVIIIFFVNFIVILLLAYVLGLIIICYLIVDPIIKIIVCKKQERRQK